MASSGDYSFNPSTYQIITGAMRLIGAIQTGEVPPAEEYEDALSALNGLTTHWQASGIHVWSEVDCMLFLQPGQNTYYIGTGTSDHCCLSSDWVQTYLVVAAGAGASTITVADTTGIAASNKIAIVNGSTPSYFWTTVASAGGSSVSLTSPLPATAVAGARVVAYGADQVRPLKVPAARRLIYAGNLGTPTKIETPLSVYSRIDYAAVPNKDNPGEVTAFFYDPKMGQGVIHTWPTPGDVNQAMQFTAQRPLQDFVSQRDNADLPVEWISTLRYNLAVELAPEYDVPAERFKIIQVLAGEKLLMCQSWDREPESVYFGLQTHASTRNT